MKLLLLSLTVSLITTAQAQSPRPNTSAPPPACTAPEFRQFDFWVGKWKVINPQTGKEAGTSEVTRASEGCAIREQWKAANGIAGMSVNYFDASNGEWHQDWVGGDGTILHLHGRLISGAMVLTGDTKTTQGTTLNRITWSQLDGGKVKQEWSTSSDQGRSWKTSFVGIYEKQS